MNFAEAQNDLDSRINLEAILSRKSRGLDKPSLKSISSVLDYFGHPEKDFASFHVTGTNGKGSVSTSIAHILQVAGYRVGLYTSPDLSGIRERIRINGVEIEEENFISCLTEISAVEEKLNLKLTRFELLTAMAFLYFSTEGVEFASIEVGLGGRYDATNVIYPEVSVVTNIGHDHLDLIGPSLENVAYEKSGIIKKNAPVVLGSISGEPLKILLNEAMRTNSKALIYGEHFGITDVRQAVGGWAFNYFSERGVIEDLGLLLRGKFQLINAAISICSLEQAFSSRFPENALRTALLELSIPGRIEVINKGKVVILDGAHNKEGIVALASVISEEFKNIRGYTLVISSLRDKDPEEIFDPLLTQSAISSVIVTSIDSPRAIDPLDLSRQLSKRFPLLSISSYPDNANALFLALQDRSSQGVIVTGSMYLVGSMRKILLKEPGKIEGKPEATVL